MDKQHCTCWKVSDQSSAVEPLTTRSIGDAGTSRCCRVWYPGTTLSFEKEDYVREFSVAVPLASKKTFPQKATIMARTAQQSITVRFDDDSKNSWYSLEEA